MAFAVLEGRRLEIAVPTSHLMGQLGMLLWAKALHKEAETLERDALSIDKKHFGPDSTEAAVRLNNLATTFQSTNRLSEAEPLTRRCLDITAAFRKSTGCPHPKSEARKANYRQLLQAMGLSAREIAKRSRATE